MLASGSSFARRASPPPDWAIPRRARRDRRRARRAPAAFVRPERGRGSRSRDALRPEPRDSGAPLDAAPRTREAVPARQPCPRESAARAVDRRGCAAAAGVPRPSGMLPRRHTLQAGFHHFVATCGPWSISRGALASLVADFVLTAAFARRPAPGRGAASGRYAELRQDDGSEEQIPRHHGQSDSKVSPIHRHPPSRDPELSGFYVMLIPPPGPTFRGNCVRAGGDGPGGPQGEAPRRLRRRPILARI